jgi:hypothetical protein
MADRDLIHSYLDALAQRLPSEALEELADGLEETFQRYLGRGLSPAEAADSAIAEFGRPTQVTTAFARQSSGRRTAFALLATAPVFAVLWGTTLITTQAWNWPIPTGAAVAFGVIRVAVAASLLAVAKSNNPTTTRLAGPRTAGLRRRPPPRHHGRRLARQTASPKASGPNAAFSWRSTWPTPIPTVRKVAASSPRDCGMSPSAVRRSRSVRAAARSKPCSWRNRWARLTPVESSRLFDAHCACPREPRPAALRLTGLTP